MALFQQFGVNQPINEVPADGTLDYSVTPYLDASAYMTTLTIQEIDDPGNLDMTVSLAVSRDGVRFGPDIPRSLGQYGQYAERIQWADPGGLGRFESFAALRVRTTAPIEFAPDALIVDVSNVNR